MADSVGGGIWVLSVVLYGWVAAVVFALLSLLLSWVLSALVFGTLSKLLSVLLC